MCGIFGISATQDTEITPRIFQAIFRELAILSERRGKEASGFAILKDDEMNVYKSPLPVKKMIQKKEYRQHIGKLKNQRLFSSKFITAIGHSRLVTDGTEKLNINNQPLEKNGIVGVHNGIVVNHKQLWLKHKEQKQESSLDSEIILTLIAKYYEEKKSLKKSIMKTYDDIYGLASIALIFRELNNLLLTTNNGSIYYIVGKDKKSFFFASESIILSTILKKKSINLYFDKNDIMQLKSRCACLINLNTNEMDEFHFNDSPDNEFKTLEKNSNTVRLQQLSGEECFEDAVNQHQETLEGPIYNLQVFIPQRIIENFDKNVKQIQALKRCSKCLIPETFPFIQFDSQGVCNYCLNYKKLTFLGKDELEKKIAPYRKSGGKSDCIIGFSGGRDSSYMLHYFKKHLNMNPIAYSYDWGMLTDLGRRNQSRMCAALGIEHILLSADIRKKRKYIRKNVQAWLKRPQLGTIPLFMAGDKQYFYYANQLMEQYGTKLIVFGENLLETTFFKYGFCDIPPNFNKKKSFSLSGKAKLKMALYYGKEYLRNPAYLNSSLLDTIGAFMSFYYIPHTYINFYNYIKWEEQEIVTQLIGGYDWEIAPDTDSTWRIGDGTASIYNYIYYMVAGFSEIETFRSNQIREGMIDREEGLKKIYKENGPRYDSIKWYCNTIGIDFESTMERINQIPKIYDK
jgi:glutamine---fructose-6-phosphate transaminase (isomerizing)